MAYGTGPIPFIRTSDISNWELKIDPKQGVSQDIYERHRQKQDVRTDDVLVVRDGTYLVGTSCILTDADTRILYCGGIYKLRVLDPDVLDPYLFLVLLNTPIVRRQMRTKQLTRDVIDTLGHRIFEVFLPVPRNSELRKELATIARQVVGRRVALREEARQIAASVEEAALASV